MLYCKGKERGAGKLRITDYELRMGRIGEGLNAQQRGKRGKKRRGRLRLTAETRQDGEARGVRRHQVFGIWFRKGVFGRKTQQKRRFLGKIP